MRAGELTTARRTSERDQDAVGAWQVLDDELPFPAAHAALLPTGRVLLFPGGRTQGDANRAPKACLWDCHAGSLRTWNLPADFSLGAQCFLPDGRLLVLGGIKEQATIRLRETYLFDAATEDFLKVNDMPERGPCPTLIELGDGGVLAVGGSGRSRIQAYGKATGWTATTHAEMDWPLYPQLTLLAGGSIFFSGQHFGGRALINPGILQSSGAFTELPEAAVPPDFLYAFREQGATLPLPPVQEQKVLILGGGGPSRPDVHIIDFSRPDPVLDSAAPMPFPRASFSTAILPDHTILVCGGVRFDEAGPSVAREAQLYDPLSGVWTSAATSQVPRPDHSSAILLPDGRVMTAGSTDRYGHGELRVELYHPPYLFRGDRPVLEDAPSEITYGGFFSIKTADSDVRQLSLVKPMAVSHGFDAGQRLVDVAFESRGGGLLEAVAPENPNIAPPGQYLLFLINHKGTPSYGRWVLLSEPSRTHGIWTDHLRSNIDAGYGGGGLGRHSWNGSDPRRDPVPLQTSDQQVALKAAEGAIEDADLRLQDDESPFEQAHEVVPWLPERADVSAADAPPQPADFLLEEPLETRWLDEPANPLWWDENAPDNQRFGMSGRATVHWGPVIPWHRWGRPALIVASAGLLALSMVVDAAPLQAGAAFIFLLFAPGMALVGLHPPSDWASEVALAIGLSVALETLLTVAGLYFGIWSAEGILLVLLVMSLSGGIVQLIQAAFGQSGRLESTARSGEAPA